MHYQLEALLYTIVGMGEMKWLAGELLEICFLLATLATDGISRASTCKSQLWLFEKAGTAYYNIFAASIIMLQNLYNYSY